MAKRKRLISSRAYIDALDMAKGTRSVGEVVHDFQSRHDFQATSSQERGYLTTVRNALGQLRRMGEIEPYESDTARSDLKMYFAETKQDEQEIETWERQLDKENRAGERELAEVGYD